MVAYIGGVLVAIISLFSLVLVVRIILSWFVLPPSRWLYWLYKITDPVINFAKTYFPVRIGIIDLSIIFPFIFLSLLSNVITDLMILGVPFSMFYVIELFIRGIDMLFGFVMSVLFIFVVVTLLVNIILPYTYNPIVTAMKSVIEPMALFLRRIVRINSRYEDKLYLVILGVLFLLLGFVGHLIFMFLLGIVHQLNVNSFKILPLDKNVDPR
ncbi:MAG: hypothetical protein A2086_11545 [Spirochaetes bacterium GWD1_27_9]|nr:MAG: hypothetical protein A2Y34_05365 [Spirochaetes bacterium GWC1_27_15]OHD36562.1 MAG: hypothetical protein A2086_11545 [Spirochaetes bacterium GWD1_27_9]